MQMQTFRFLNSSQGEELVNLGQFRVFTNKNISVCQDRDSVQTPQ